MKINDVEQDPETHLPGPRLAFAVDDTGHYQIVESVGNNLGTLTVKMMWEHINEQVGTAAEKVRAGQESPLAFFMARKIMDCGLLAPYVGMASWRIKRHLRPSVFKKLKTLVLQRYADFFGVTTEEFVNPQLDRIDPILGKKGNDYLVSDFLTNEITLCPEKDLRKARFSKGAMAPRGRMVTIQKVPDRLRLAHTVSAGIREVCSTMLQPLFPIVGIKGIRYFANRMEKWPSTLGESGSRRNLGNVIMMQEEIGTGGAGFRYMFAAFLEDAATILNDEKLLRISGQMTQTGDKWRSFAVQAARHCKGRSRDREGFPSYAAILRECADEEESIFRELRKIVPKIPAG